MNSEVEASSPRITDVLALGFGTSLAMWFAGYLCRLPFISLPAWLAAILMLACLIAGGYYAGRFSRRGWTAGMLSGLVASIINLLILGSLLSGNRPGSILPSALIWLPGSLLAGTALGALGGACGAAARRTAAGEGRAPLVNWLGSFALVTAGASLLLIAAGGLVTSEEAGLAVVDWPNSFGYNMFLYPLSRMTGGIYFEHAHRLLGSLTGLTGLALALLLQFAAQPRAVKLLGWCAFALVCIQGVLGGLRVTGTLTLSDSPAAMSPSTLLATVHGVVGQLVFALLVALVALVSTRYRHSAGTADKAARTMQLLGAWLVASIVLQVVLGAVLRHYDWGLHLHIAVACVVVAMALIVGLRCKRNYKEQPVLVQKGGAMMHLAVTQLALGIVAIGAMVLAGEGPRPPLLEVLIVTAHQTVGALVLAYALTLTLWLRRLLRPVAVST